MGSPRGEGEGCQADRLGREISWFWREQRGIDGE